MRDYSTGRLPKSDADWSERLRPPASAGNTVIGVEHNLDVIKTADWIIDLGPEGGAAGGQIVAEGRPGQVVKVADSHTGGFLAEILR